MNQIENTHIRGFERLPAPRELKESLPLAPEARALVGATRGTIRDLLHGRDPQRLLMVVGPCSIHEREVALEYAERLRKLADELGDVLVLVMRTYFEKPRTTVGWKGYLSDPRLDGSDDVAAGLHGARSLLREIHALGMPCASEVLDPITPQYLGDLLSWVAIGARTAESQSHRAMASGLSAPVGFKNGTDGSVETARNAMRSAAAPHRFLGIDEAGRAAVVHTLGNPDCHLVLRGGRGGPNYDAACVDEAAGRAAELGVARPVMVDCSHDNSGKDHTRQGAVCRAVLDQLRGGSGSILGLMLESHLEPGRQSWEPGVPLERGVSITDACIGWGETERLLGETAETLRKVQGGRSRAGS